MINLLSWAFELFTHESTILSRPPSLSTFLSTQKSGFILKSALFSGLLFLVAYSFGGFLSAQKSAQGLTEPLFCFFVLQKVKVKMKRNWSGPGMDALSGPSPWNILAAPPRSSKNGQNCGAVVGQKKVALSNLSNSRGHIRTIWQHWTMIMIIIAIMIIDICSMCLAPALPYPAQ